MSYAAPEKYNVPCRRSWADFISDINNIVHRENPAQCPSSGKNPPKFINATAGGTFLKLGLNSEKSLPPSLSDLSLSYLSISNPSISKSSVSSPWSVWLLKHKE